MRLDDGPTDPAATGDRIGDASFVDLIEQVSAATWRAQSPAEAVAAALRGICEWTGWPVGHSYRAAGTADEPLRPTTIWHLVDPDRFDEFRRVTEATVLTAGVGLPGRIIASGRPAWIADATLDPNFPRREACLRAGLRGAFAVPVSAGEMWYGMLECFSTRVVTPDARLLEVSAHIGRQLGRVIESLKTGAALRESESRLRSVTESATDAIIVADRHGAITSWNRGAARIFGYAADEVVGRPLTMLMPERFRAAHDAGVGRVARHGEAAGRLLGTTAEVVGLRRDGREFPLELSLATWEGPTGRCFSGIIRDISERRKAQERITTLLETAPDPIVEFGPDGRIVLANARTDELFGHRRSGLIGADAGILFAGRSRELVTERLAAIAAGDGLADGSLVLGDDVWGLRRDGSEFPVEVTVSTVMDDEGPVVTAIIRDATDRRRFEAQLKHLADHDVLTELFNRRRFEAELEDYGDYARRYGERGAVVLLDLDRFKYVNDTHGHKAGDEVIRAVGSALRDSVRASDVVARLGGDEFAVLLKNVDRSEAERVADTMLATVHERELPIAGFRSSMTTSIGIALLDADSVAEGLLVDADLAMYAAKEAGGNRWEVSADHGDRLSNMQTRLGWVEQIRRGLDEDRFVLHCQPIIHLATGQVTQWELLLRLRGDDGELIPPAAFIPTAERFGLIQEIDRWVVARAIELLEVHRDRPGGLRLEVNVSGKSMSDPLLLALIEEQIHLRDVDPRNLVLEITETAAIADMEKARAFADRLTALGCRFALDDFGAGFSSFYYLKYLPLSYLKIDGDFVRALTSSVTDQLVVQSMVDIARGMGMRTIAEFVEVPATAEMLRAKGVDYSQGYYHGRPQPVEDALSATPDAAADGSSAQARIS
ncbi:MAG: EAL domain-containing protein [Solirubrobacteraceae bacterium]